MNIARGIDRRPRRGAAFLILIVMVSLAVVGATQILVRGELTSRRSESDRLRMRSMRTALDAIKQVADGSYDSLRLPIDVSTGEFIEVTLNHEDNRITAQWIKGQQVIDELKQVIQTKVESSE